MDNVGASSPASNTLPLVLVSATTAAIAVARANMDEKTKIMGTRNMPLTDATNSALWHSVVCSIGANHGRYPPC